MGMTGLILLMAPILITHLMTRVMRRCARLRLIARIMDHLLRLPLEALTQHPLLLPKLRCNRRLHPLDRRLRQHLRALLTTVYPSL